MSTSAEILVGGAIAITAVAIVFRRELAKVSIKGALLILLGVCLAFGAKELEMRIREIHDRYL